MTQPKTRLVFGGRGFGKTAECIRTAAKTNAYIVVPTSREATEVFHLAKEIGLSIPFPMTIHEFARGDWGREVKGFIFDGIEYLLRKMCRDVPIELIAVDTSSYLTCIEVIADPNVPPSEMILVQTHPAQDQEQDEAPQSVKVINIGNKENK